MRVLIVFHGWLPRADRPASGGAMRAWHHGEALRAAGHEVLYLTRDQDALPGGPPTYASARHLSDYVAMVRPDRIVCVQPEEAPALRGHGIPLCVDLYAPRLLEAGWQGDEADESVRTLRAITAGDHFLFSNARQRWFYLGLLTLAGVDVRTESGSIVPLVAPEGPPRRRPRSPVFVMGGVSWPWQDPTDALRRAVTHLESRRKGKIVVYGGRPAIGDSEVVDLPAAVPPGKRLQYMGAVPLPELLEAYAGASAALDVMVPNPEREVALAFRHVDYLGCGLAMITGDYHPLSEAIAAAGAGWVVGEGELEAALDAVLDDTDEAMRRGQAAKELAGTFSREVAEAPLIEWVERGGLRARGVGPLPERAELVAKAAVAEAERRAAEGLQARAEAEVVDKRAEMDRLNGQIAALTGTVERLTRSLDEVAGFKREAVRVLGSETEALTAETRELSRELADLKADVAKKDGELRSARREVDRLNDALVGAQKDAAYSGERLLEVGGQVDALKQERDGLREEKKRGLLSRVLKRR